VFVERFWRTLKYEEVYLKAYESVAEARSSIGHFMQFYNPTSEHPSFYVVEGNRFCWLGSGPVGCPAAWRARSTIIFAADPASAVRLKIHGP
jgi:transposase InsO family protein